MNIYLYGNCQTEALRKVILEAHPAWPVEALNLSIVSVFDEAMVARHFARAQEAEIVIAQPVGNYRDNERLSTQALLGSLRPGTQVIMFPSIVFEGVQGAYNYLDKFVTGYRSDYHNAHTIDLYLSGYRWDDIAIVQNSPEYYTDEFVRTGIEASLSELRTRETQGDCDISVAKFLDERCRSELLMNTINHPKRPVLVHIIREAFRLLGLRGEPTEDGPDYLPYPQFPPLPTVLYHLGWQDTSPGVLFYDGIMSRRDYVTGSLAYYARWTRPRVRQAYEKSRAEEFITAFRRTPEPQSDSKFLLSKSQRDGELVSDAFVVFLQRDASVDELESHRGILRNVGMREWLRILAHSDEFKKARFMGNNPPKPVPS